MDFLFYVGLVLAVAFLALSIFLFFTQKILQVIRFMLKMPSEKQMKPKKTNRIFQKEAALGSTGTEILGGDATEVLSIAQNFATVLLDTEGAGDLSTLEE